MTSSTSIRRTFLLLLVSVSVQTHRTSAFVPSSQNRGRLEPTFMSKNSDRAHLEKNFEDMMDNDWRVFRARLVAQENAEAQEKAMNSPASRDDEWLAGQGQLGDLFAEAFSSFSKTNAKKDSSKKHDLYEGRSIGGALPDDIVSQDPFVSAAELPIFLKSKVNIDKHRWAHEISHIEPGCILVAHEKLRGVFHQTVVLIIDHDELNGSTGIVINRPLDGNLHMVSSGTESNLDSTLKLAFTNSPVAYGGPVHLEGYSVLHGWGEVDGSKKVASGVFIGGSKELVDEVRTNRFDPTKALFVKGHAEWQPGHLDWEISKGVWYTAAASSDLIMRYAGAPVNDHDNRHDLWSDVLTCMGGYYADIARAHADHGDTRLMP